MTDEQKNALHAIIAGLLGLAGNKVIWTGQNMPRLKRPFATMQVISERHEVREDYKPAGAGVYDVIVPCIAMVSVQYYGDDALDKVADMVRGLERYTIVDRCAAAGLAVYNEDGTLDTSGLLDGETWEERATVDLRTRYNSVVRDEPGYIDTVEVDGGTGEQFTVDGKDGK